MRVLGGSGERVLDPKAVLARGALADAQGIVVAHVGGQDVVGLAARPVAAGHHWERDGELDVEELQTLLLGRQRHDLLLEPLVLLLQRVQSFEHLYNVDASFPVALLLQQLLDVGGGLGDILQLPAAAAGHRLVKEGRQAADGGHGRETLLGRSPSAAETAVLQVGLCPAAFRLI